MTRHVPLHELDVGESGRTAGRLQTTEVGWRLTNARVAIPLQLDSVDADLESGSLVRVRGHREPDGLCVEELDVVHRPTEDEAVERPAGAPASGELTEIWHETRRAIRAYFFDEGFREVSTPHAVAAPGTDPYVDPVGTRTPADAESGRPPAYLHTSPEFSMKRLLAEGAERIFQIGPVWRSGDETPWHRPEFEMLEWYRAWEGVEPILEDVEEVVTRVLEGEAKLADSSDGDARQRTISLERPFERITMRELVEEACGFDLFEALDYASLREACLGGDLLDGDVDRRHPPEEGRWDALFFELMVTQLEPELAERSAVFVVDWPAELGILARRDPDEPRVARRFELFVGGVELANGFDELTNPDEQRRRFERDLEIRRELGKPELPLPTSFLKALEYGLPPSAGVALGVDRLVMLAEGLPTIDHASIFPV